LVERIQRSKWDKPASDVAFRVKIPENFKHQNERSDEADEEFRASLTQAAEHDTDPGIRAAAAMVVGYFWHDDPASLTWLRKLIHAERNPEVLSLLKEIKQSMQ